MNHLTPNLLVLIEKLISKGLLTESIEEGQRFYIPSNELEGMVDIPDEGIYSCQECFLGAVENLKNDKRTDVTLTIYPIEKTKNHLCLGCFSKNKFTTADGIVRMRKL